MMTFAGRVVGVVGVLLIFLSARVQAQSLRDPTVAPIEAGQSSTAVDGASSDAPPAAMTIIVRNGRPFVVVGTRLYAQGQKLGQARIERISETEVWLREGRVLRKVPQFSGIQRRTVTPVAAKPTCAVSAFQSSQPAAFCADTQP